MIYQEFRNHPVVQERCKLNGVLESDFRLMELEESVTGFTPNDLSGIYGEKLIDLEIQGRLAYEKYLKRMQEAEADHAKVKEKYGTYFEKKDRIDKMTAAVLPIIQNYISDAEYNKADSIRRVFAEQVAEEYQDKPPKELSDLERILQINEDDSQDEFKRLETAVLDQLISSHWQYLLAVHRKD